MSELEGDFDSFAVDPKHYAPLRCFCCGKHGSRSEQEVNRLVREYSSGRHKGSVFRVTVDGRKRIVGVAAFLAAAPSQPMLGQFTGSPYISVIGLSERYRGRGKGGLRLGDLVLLDALRAITKSWGGAPHTFALVDPNNRASRNLFERNGFRMIIRANRNSHEADSLFRRIGVQSPVGSLGGVSMPLVTPSETGTNAGARAQ